MAIRPYQQNQTHGKFAASQRTGEFADTSHSLSLVVILKDIANLNISGRNVQNQKNVEAEI